MRVYGYLRKSLNKLSAKKRGDVRCSNRYQFRKPVLMHVQIRKSEQWISKMPMQIMPMYKKHTSKNKRSKIWITIFIFRQWYQPFFVTRHNTIQTVHLILKIHCLKTFTGSAIESLLVERQIDKRKCLLESTEEHYTRSNWQVQSREYLLSSSQKKLIVVGGEKIKVWVSGENFLKIHFIWNTLLYFQ